MGRIENAFTALKGEGKKGFIPYITAGDPDLAITEELLITLSQTGATLIELGVPFSDPMADGPVIQRASERALKHNFGLLEILEIVARTRKQTDVPIILFSYYNPLFQFGLKRLAEAAKDAGVDGILVTDQRDGLTGLGCETDVTEDGTSGVVLARDVAELHLAPPDLLRLRI